MSDEQQAKQDIQVDMFAIFDKQRLKDGNLKLKGMSKVGEGELTDLYLSNPGLGLNHADMAMALVVKNADRLTMFGEGWKDLVAEDGEGLRPLMWGVQLSWSNHARRVYGPISNAKDAVIAVQNAYNELLGIAERTLTSIAYIQLGQALLHQTQSPRPTKTESKPARRRKSPN